MSLTYFSVLWRLLLLPLEALPEEAAVPREVERTRVELGRHLKVGTRLQRVLK